MALIKVIYVDGETVITAENLNDIQDAIIALENAPAQGLTEDMKQALLQIARKVAYIDDQGQTYYDDLYDAFYPPKTVVLITAVFEQGSTVIYDDTALDELKQYLTVTAKYDDNTTAILPDGAYTLSGLLEAPSSTVTVLYNGVSTTFSVDVTARPTLNSISAVYTQGNRTVFSNDSLDSLKPYLVVTATYSDSSTETVSADDYTLNGTLEAGTSTITVSYGGKTATFDVTVTAFVIPEGYTRYDYIKKKSDSGSKHTFGNFIVLNSQEDMNSLSVEIYLARKNITANPGFLGARAVDYFPSVSFYCPAQNNDYLRFTIRGVQTATHIDLATDRATKVEIINPNSSPAYWRLNNGALHEIEWENSVVNPYGLCLFNNIPQEGLSPTATWDICQSAIIGDIILRKADGECVGYYLPCVYSGKIGMYDIISETFYTATTAAAVTISNSGCLYAVGNW